jgi:hypothetical protein
MFARNADNNANILKIEKESISETLTTFYHTKQDHVSEGTNPHDTYSYKKYPEDVGRELLRNICNSVSDFTASHSRRKFSLTVSY